MSTQFFHRQQRPTVFETVAQKPDHGIVTAVLALDPDLIGQPPDSRVIEKKCFDLGLDKFND